MPRAAAWSSWGIPPSTCPILAAISHDASDGSGLGAFARMRQMHHRAYMRSCRSPAYGEGGSRVARHPAAALAQDDRADLAHEHRLGAGKPKASTEVIRKAKNTGWPSRSL